jgi:hypothetical protein
VELMTYYVIFQSAMDNPVKEKVLKQLEEWMIMMWQNQQMQSPALQGMANAAAAQTTSASLQSQGNQVESLQSIS